MASDLVLNLNDSNFDAEIASSTVPVIVDFWAEWCGPCRMLGPVLDKLAEEKAGEVKVVKVNVDHAPELSAKYGVRSIPMLLFMKGGEVKETVVGVQSKDALLAKLVEQRQRPLLEGRQFHARVRIEHSKRLRRRN